MDDPKGSSAVAHSILLQKSPRRRFRELGFSHVDAKRNQVLTPEDRVLNETVCSLSLRLSRTFFISYSETEFLLGKVPTVCPKPVAKEQ